jgi:phosphomannomutase
MSVPPDLPVGRLVTGYFLRDSASAYPVECDGTVIGLVSQGREPLSAIGATLPKYQMVKTSMSLTREQFAERSEKLAKAFEGAVVDQQDGLKFSLEDSWVHARPSNTEPIVRIIAEAKTDVQAKAVVDKVRQALSANGREPEKK